MDIRSVYQVARIDRGTVYIIDCFEDNPEVLMKTVTNDAERVCAELYNMYGASRIVYRDTEGRWDELVHERGRFIDYKPAQAPEGF